jgi:hypothetical protein
MTSPNASIQPAMRKCEWRKCPEGVQYASEVELDQSGDTFLPALAWTCNHCAVVVIERIPDATWRARLRE